MIVDIGPATLAKWASVLRSAKTIVWNGPLGITEFEQMGFGSRFIARMIASRTQYGTWTLAGGGDTIPVIAGTGVQEDYTFISTGGGALLEFVTAKGLLPGIQPLLK
jgi:phosphoglycerate kinase